MKKDKAIQYTIRSVPSEVNEAVREYTVRENCSLNQAVLETLRRGAGVSDKKVIYRDLSFLAGSWIEDPACDEALEQFDQIDENLWK